MRWKTNLPSEEKDRPLLPAQVQAQLSELEYYRYDKELGK